MKGEERAWNIFDRGHKMMAMMFVDSRDSYLPSLDG